MGVARFELEASVVSMSATVQHRPDRKSQPWRVVIHRVGKRHTLAPTGDK